jgi:ligand-binding sensor domain-containing protein
MMKMRNSYSWVAALLLLITVVCTSRVFALDPKKTINQYGHNVWSRQNGLPADAVNAVLQTRDGFLWLGTQKGLVRFDGAHFIDVSTNPKNDGTHEWITPLYILTVKTIIVNETLSNFVKERL